MKKNIEPATALEIGEVQEKLEKMATALEDDRFLPTIDPETEDHQTLELVQALRIDKKVKTELRKIENPGKSEMKTLVNLYYQMQDQRTALRNQIRAIESEEGKEANIILLDWCMKNSAITEKGVQDSLKIICDQTEVGRWLQQIVGMGPVLSAGCLAYFDVRGKHYASQFISYAGLNDNNRPFIGRKGADAIMSELDWGKTPITDEMVAEYAARTQWSFEYLRSKAFNEKTGKWSKTDLCAAAAKIPYNKELKTLMWKIGQSFNWQCNNPRSLYGRLFSERRIIETARNEGGEYADQAAHILATKNIGKSTTAYQAYSAGMLPKAHINARAQRWAEKIFISHLFEEMYRVEYNRKPPRYYILEKDPLHNKEIEPEVPYYEVPDDKEPSKTIPVSALTLEGVMQLFPNLTSEEAERMMALFNMTH